MRDARGQMLRALEEAYEVLGEVIDAWLDPTFAPGGTSDYVWPRPTGREDLEEFVEFHEIERVERVVRDALQAGRGHY